MTTRFTLQNLLDLAQTRTDTAARSLGKTLSREQTEDQKLQMLIEYRRDYQASFQLVMKNGVSPASLRNYHEFMNKLDLAVKQQMEMVTHWQRQSMASRDDWEAEQRRLKSFDTLHDRHQQTEQKRATKAEQKAHDEYSATAYLRLAGNE